MSAADVFTQTVEYPSDGFTIRAFVARPAGAKERRPVVVILHEWWGLNDHIKDIAQRFAREGYVGVAVDLYSRQQHKTTKDAAEASALMSALSSQDALRDINATTTFLKSLPFADDGRMAVLGFCMGGTFALMVAGHNSEFKAAVPFYGKVPPIETIAYLLCPVLFHHGAKDGWVTKKEVDTLREGLAKFGKTGEVASYPEADHAFFNDTRPEVYRPVEAKQAWQRTLRFLGQQLR